MNHYFSRFLYESQVKMFKELANPNTALASLKLHTQYVNIDGDLPAGGTAVISCLVTTVAP
jgi:hypothetical protein